MKDKQHWSTPRGCHPDCPACKTCDECEVYARYAEKFGDLSCCYDAKDVTRVIDRRIEMLLDVVREARNWSAAKNEEEHWTYRRALREALTELDNTAPRNIPDAERAADNA